MFSIENKLKDFLEKNVKIFFLVIITVLSIFVRTAGKDFLSWDMQSFLIPWFDEIKSYGGLSALNRQIGNYNLLYQTIISFFTYNDMDCMYQYKILSCVFDYLLAAVSGLLVCCIRKKSWKNSSEFDITYAAVLFAPTVFFNSAYWGQCDSIYTFFIVLTVYLILKEKYIPAFISLGLCFGFKLQAIFILPFIIFIYFRKKNISVLYFLCTLISFCLTGTVAYVKGRSFTDIFTIYAEQSDTYQSMFLNTASFWKLVGDNYEYMSRMAILFTVALLGTGLYIYIVKSAREQTDEDHLLMAVWTMWTVIIFLPAMHERYTFPLDVMLIVLCVINRKYIVIAASEIIISLMTYGFYLFGNGAQTITMSVVNLGLYSVLSYVFFRKILSQNAVPAVSEQK